MNNREIYMIAVNQLAIDYNCSPDDFTKEGVIFTEAQKLEGRREMPFSEPRLEVITMGRSTIVNASKLIMPRIKELFEGKSRYEILTSPLVFGVNPYYLPDTGSLRNITSSNYRFQLIDTNIQDYYKYKEFKNALQYDHASKRPEVLAAIAYNHEELAGIACASADSNTMWQISVDILPAYRGKGIAVNLVNMLTIETLNRGIVPYYTTDCGNINSQKVAVKCGYIPAWSHCFRTRLSEL